MYRIIFILLTLITRCDVLLAQCPMCKSALVSSPEGQQMASAFNTGILVLLAAPFVLMTSIGLFIAGKCRRARNEKKLDDGINNE